MRGEAVQILNSILPDDKRTTKVEEIVLGKFYSPRQSMNSDFLIIQWQGDDGEIIQNGDKREQLFGRIGGLNMEKRRGMRCTL